MIDAGRQNPARGARPRARPSTASRFSRASTSPVQKRRGARDHGAERLGQEHVRESAGRPSRVRGHRRRRCCFEGKDLFELKPEERARAGLFLGFQYPVEIPGVSQQRCSCGSPTTRCRAQRGKDELDPLEFDDFVREKMKLLDMDPDFLDRSVNEGFSGGEKKRNEILQMALLEPHARDSRRNRFRARHRRVARRRRRRQSALRTKTTRSCWSRTTSGCSITSCPTMCT